MPTRKRFRQLAALVLLLLSAGLLGWGFWPQTASAQSLALRPQDLQLPTAELEITPSPTPVDAPGGGFSEQPILLTPEVTPNPTMTASPPALQELRRLVLEFPAQIRQGDSASIRLTLRLDDVGAATAPAAGAGDPVSGVPVVVADVYATHRVMAQARLDLAGLESVPAAGQTQLQALLPGQEISFQWSVRAAEIAHYSGVVWFSLRYEPLDGGPALEQVIAAQPVEIECVNFVGLGGTPARLMGGAGILVGVLLSKDTTADFIKKYRNSRKTRTGAARKTASRKRSVRKTRAR